MLLAVIGSNGATFVGSASIVWSAHRTTKQLWLARFSRDKLLVIKVNVAVIACFAIILLPRGF